MEVYLVGGAVRDQILGRPVRERDWVVVGSSPEEMAELGYRQVGRDFPVFLHPETGDEYALARTERKSAPGHGGFICHTGPEVTLEDDLERRDLTINAMAEDEAGHRIDPFGGAGDLEQRLLRHVSEAFVEDPLRVFRVARFAAQLPGFRVAEETLALMTEIARSGELDVLSAERVFGELKKALAGSEPVRFFAVLRAAGALAPWFSEFVDLEVGVPDTLPDELHRFAALGWLLTPNEAETLCARLKSPKVYARLMVAVARHGVVLANWRGKDARAVLDSLKATGAFRDGTTFEQTMAVIRACSGVDMGPLGEAVNAVNEQAKASKLPTDLSGAVVGEALDALRVQGIRTAQS